MWAWYLRRAIPWQPLLVSLAVAAAVAGVAHRWETMSALCLPLAALTAAAGSAFVLDEPAAAVTSVTPRGARAAVALRLLVATVPIVVGVVVVATAPGSGDAAQWLLVVTGLVAVVLLSVLIATRRIAQPGNSVASAVVLVGLAPIVVGMFIEIPSAYPVPDPGAGAIAAWTACIGVCAAGIALVLLSGARPAATARTGHAWR